MTSEQLASRWHESVLGDMRMKKEQALPTRGNKQPGGHRRVTVRSLCAFTDVREGLNSVSSSHR